MQFLHQVQDGSGMMELITDATVCPCIDDLFGRGGSAAGWERHESGGGSKPNPTTWFMAL